ncbi:M20/M25/M40 family metallo-hydrolase [Luedemannella flava]
MHCRHPAGGNAAQRHPRLGVLRSHGAHLQPRPTGGGPAAAAAGDPRDRGRTGVTAEVVIEPFYPATVNDAAEVTLVRDVVAALPGTRYQELAGPLTTAEDFSYVLEQVPGAMVLLGAGPRGIDLDRQAPNHSASVVFDDDVLALGARLYAEWAVRRLRDAVPASHHFHPTGGAEHAHLV